MNIFRLKYFLMNFHKTVLARKPINLKTEDAVIFVTKDDIK